MFNESVSKKIHVPLVLSMFIGLLTILINFFYSVEDIRSEVYSSQSKELRTAYVNALREKKVIALTNVINLSSNYSIIESLKSRDRNVAIAGLQTLSQKFKEQTIYKNIKVHLHDANLRSFLRTWDVEKHGEDLAGFRKTLRDVKENKKAIATIELGRAGLLIRGIAPIENDGVYLGSVEFMQGFNSIVKNLRKNREYETAFLMKEDYLSVATALSSSRKVKEFVLALKEKNVDKGFLNSLKGVDIEDTKNFQISDEYFLVSEPIKDFSNVIVGYALIGEKTSMVETVIAKAKSSLLKQVYIIFFIDIIILIYLIIIVRKKIIRPIVDMEKMAQELSLGGADLSKRLPVKSNDEFGRASKSFNLFLEKVESIAMEAQEANRSKSAFLSNMSHEIRTPMNAILGFAEILNDEINDKRLKSYLKTINSSGKTLLYLINDILDLSKIESGKLEIIKKSVHAQELFMESVNIFQLQAQDKGLELTFEMDEKTPPSLLLDPVRVKEILINLIGNALKFTDAGRVSLKVLVEEVPNNSSVVNLIANVRDSGIGISSKNLKNIFESFEQTEKQDVRKYGGTGLGLSISKKLAGLMDGSLEVESEEGEGSTFTLRLNSVSIASMSEESESKALARSDLKFHGSKILLVDDVDENRFLIIETLRSTNLEIVEAVNGEEAVELAKADDFDLVFMDIRMPVMDGYVATRLIREFNDSVPIVALTASIMQSELEKLQEKRFNDYVRKPVTREELYGVLAEYLECEEPDETLEKENEADAVDSSVEEEILDLDGFIEVLQSDIKELYEKSRGTNDISLITEFANALLEESKKRNATLTVKYAQEILDHIDTFDIAAMNATLDDFEKRVENLKSLR